VLGNLKAFGARARKAYWLALSALPAHSKPGLEGGGSFARALCCSAFLALSGHFPNFNPNSEAMERLITISFPSITSSGGSVIACKAVLTGRLLGGFEAKRSLVLARRI